MTLSPASGDGVEITTDQEQGRCYYCLMSDVCLWLIHDQLGSPRADAVLYQVGPGNNSWQGATLSRDQAPVSESQITLATR